MERNNKKNIILELIKWVVISTLIVITIIGNYLYRDEYNIFIRSAILIIITALIIYIIISNTQLGKLIIKLGDESLSELHKVVWPTYQDGLNTTFIVIIVTTIMSLILWGLDTILVNIISFGLRL